MKRCYVAWILVCLCSAPALAQSQQDTGLAKRFYHLGEEFYRRAAYARALEQFQEAYKLAPKPAMLYNMARCQEALGRLAEAIELYQKYLKTNPPNHLIIKARIDNLKKQLEQRKPKPAPKPASQPLPKPKPQPKPKPVLKPQPKPTSIPTPQPEPAPESRPLRTPGWALVGAGGALLATGLVMGALASDQADEMEQIGQAFDTRYADAGDVESKGKTFQALQIVGLAVGGAALASGVVLLILHRRGAGRERSAWLSPSVTPGGIVVTGGARF